MITEKHIKGLRAISGWRKLLQLSIPAFPGVPNPQDKTQKKSWQGNLRKKIALRFKTPDCKKISVGVIFRIFLQDLI